MEENAERAHIRDFRQLMVPLIRKILNDNPADIVLYCHEYFGDLILRRQKDVSNGSGGKNSKENLSMSDLEQQEVATTSRPQVQGSASLPILNEEDRRKGQNVRGTSSWEAPQKTVREKFAVVDPVDIAAQMGDEATIKKEPKISEKYEPGEDRNFFMEVGHGDKARLMQGECNLYEACTKVDSIQTKNSFSNKTLSPSAPPYESTSFVAETTYELLADSLHCPSHIRKQWNLGDNGEKNFTMKSKSDESDSESSPAFTQDDEEMVERIQICAGKLSPNSSFGFIPQLRDDILYDGNKLDEDTLVASSVYLRKNENKAESSDQKLMFSHQTVKLHNAESNIDPELQRTEENDTFSRENFQHEKEKSKSNDALKQDEDTLATNSEISQKHETEVQTIVQKLSQTFLHLADEFCTAESNLNSEFQRAKEISDIVPIQHEQHEKEEADGFTKVPYQISISGNDENNTSCITNHESSFECHNYSTTDCAKPQSSSDKRSIDTTEYISPSAQCLKHKDESPVWRNISVEENTQHSNQTSQEVGSNKFKNMHVTGSTFDRTSNLYKTHSNGKLSYRSENPVRKIGNTNSCPNSSSDNRIDATWRRRWYETHPRLDSRPFSRFHYDERVPRRAMNPRYGNMGRKRGPLSHMGEGGDVPRRRNFMAVQERTLYEQNTSDPSLANSATQTDQQDQSALRFSRSAGENLESLRRNYNSTNVMPQNVNEIGSNFIQENDCESPGDYPPSYESAVFNDLIYNQYQNLLPSDNAFSETTQIPDAFFNSDVHYNTEANNLSEVIIVSEESGFVPETNENGYNVSALEENVCIPEAITIQPNNNLGIDNSDYSENQDFFRSLESDPGVLSSQINLQNDYQMASNYFANYPYLPEQNYSSLGLDAFSVINGCDTFVDDTKICESAFGDNGLVENINQNLNVEEGNKTEYENLLIGEGEPKLIESDASKQVQTSELTMAKGDRASKDKTETKECTSSEEKNNSEPGLNSACGDFSSERNSTVLNSESQDANSVSQANEEITEQDIERFPAAYFDDLIQEARYQQQSLEEENELMEFSCYSDSSSTVSCSSEVSVGGISGENADIPGKR